MIKIYGEKGEIIKRVDTLDEKVNEHLADDTLDRRHLTDSEKAAVLASRADIAGDDILLNKTIKTSSDNKNARVVVKRLHSTTRLITSIEEKKDISGVTNELYDRWVIQNNHNLLVGEYIQVNNTSVNDGYYLVHQVTPNTFTTVRQFTPIKESQGSGGDIVPDRSALIEWDEVNFRYVLRLRDAAKTKLSIEVQDVIIHGEWQGGNINAGKLSDATKSTDINDNSDFTIWTTKAVRDFIALLMADDIGYSNITSQLQSVNLQDAVDELDAIIKDLTASEVAYDNTSSGLVATNVQEAIDELDKRADHMAASQVSYDNSSSGLIATNVQEGIDELEVNINHLAETTQEQFDNLTASEVAYDNTSSGLVATNVQEAIDTLYIKHNLNATVDPTENDDINAGYSVGSFWSIPAIPDMLVCIRNTAGNAVWKSSTREAVKMALVLG